VVSALGGSSAKTLISLGLSSFWKRAGLYVSPFKKGPDYIDAAWLSAATSRSCHHLDMFLMDKGVIINSFIKNSQNSNISLVEGNRGLFDGVDINGSFSTAELAILLKAPVILIINCKKMTGTIGAIVSGCLNYNKNLNLAGVLLNHVAEKRHENILKNTVEKNTGIPVVGAIPDLGVFGISERYLGLETTHEVETNTVSDLINSSADLIQKYVDHDKILKIARSAPALENSFIKKETPSPAPPNAPKPIIAYAKDRAFQFYYPENLSTLCDLGCTLVEINLLTTQALPKEIDALYLGGGFPERFVKELSQNNKMRESIKHAVFEKKLPVYAECGGAMYLGKSISSNGSLFPMANIFPVDFALKQKPVGHGYTVLSVNNENPFYPVGLELKGHEFHYSTVVNWNNYTPNFIFSITRGHGFTDKKDGMLINNALATYTHIHSLTTDAWAHGLINCAINYKKHLHTTGCL